MKLASALAASTAALLIAGAAQAANYDALSSFNGSSTGGAFMFGTDAGGVFKPFTASSSPCADNANFICANNGALVPAVGKVTDGGQASFSTVVVPNDVLWAHPGQDVETDIIFTAPTTGDYSFSFSATRLDTTANAGNGVTFGLRGITDSYTLPSSTPYGDGQSVLTGKSLAAGDQVLLYVNNNGSYEYDSTGIDFSVSGPDEISAAPEPGTWALMMLGVGAIGTMLGYRKRVLVDHKAKLVAIG